MYNLLQFYFLKFFCTRTISENQNNQDKHKKEHCNLMKANPNSMWAIIVIIFVTKMSTCDSAVIQAAIDLDKGIDGMLDQFLGNFNLQENGQLTKEKAAGLTTALMYLAPLLKIRGNITDSSRGFTLTFNFEASTGGNVQSRDLISNENQLEDEDDYYNTNWRGTGGIFHPIVRTIEPYVVEALNLIFSGILSTIIGNFLDSATMLHEANLV